MTEDRSTPTISIVGGAGTVGSALAFHLATSLPEGEVVLVDAATSALRAHVLDLAHLEGLDNDVTVRVGTASELKDTDVVVLAASTAGPTLVDRSAMVARNAALLAELTRDLSLVSADTLIIVATNPVDAVVSILVQDKVLDARQVVGFSLNDTLRLRAAIARHRRVPTASVEAMNLGQHGGIQVPIYSHARVHGRRVGVDDDEQAQIAEDLAGWFSTYQSHASGRSTGWASAAGISTIIGAWRDGRGEVLPCSIHLQGEYGIHGVALAVPILFEGSRPHIQEITLADGELAALAGAGAAVGRAVRALRAAMPQEIRC